MKNWKTIEKKFVKPIQPSGTNIFQKMPAHAELWAITAGERAYQIRVPIYNNPYKPTNLKNAWMRGFKRAERAFMEGLRRSKKFQESLPLEEVEA